jgi:hypothetical protein
MHQGFSTGSLKCIRDFNSVPNMIRDCRQGKPDCPHKVLDVWVLLVLHGHGGPQRKTVEAMLHRKVLSRQIKPALLDHSILVRPPYGDAKVANREIRVWHLVIENGY